MWIIPKSLHTSLSVQVMEGLTLDSGELSEMYAQSLLAKSKPSPVKTWLRRLRQGSLTLLPFGRTLKPSHGKAFEAEWTSSQEASLVNHLAPQGDEQETATHATCGPSLPMGLDEWGTLPLFSWKTLKVSSAPSSKDQSGQTQRERLFCSMSSENWSAWVTKQRREYSARAKSARPINASECSFWVVAPISAPQGEGLLMGCSETQSGINNWPTPKALEVNESAAQWAKRRLKPSAKMMGPSLTVAVQLPTQHQEEPSNTLGSRQGSPWATPYTGTKDHQGGSLEHYQRRMEIGKQVCIHGQVTLDAQAYRGKLNPRWVETLMGLPVGWVMPSCATPWTIEQTSSDSLVMELSPPQQSEPLESCGNHWPTPPASQRGDTVEIYERKSQKREAQGLGRFAPTLQVAVLMENRDE